MSALGKFTEEIMEDYYDRMALKEHVWVNEQEFCPWDLSHRTIAVTKVQKEN